MNNLKKIRGAKPSSRHQLITATNYEVVGDTPDQLLYLPAKLSEWGNDDYGDCVTAEEAFAKACHNPEIYFSTGLVKGWASYNGYLNGANICSVMDTMQNYGFPMSGISYNDGNYSGVNWTDDDILKNAIATGPVKIGVGADQLQDVHKSNNGWFATGFTTGDTEDHCVSLCGYGTLSWLASQFNVSVPNGINPDELGYALFTWGSIGIIDVQSMINITYEAWVRNPTTVNVDAQNVYFGAQGGESGDVLSHAHDEVGLHGGYGGTGELFYIYNLGNGAVALGCGGGESGQFLSHANGEVSLQSTFKGDGETWKLNDIGNNQITIECLGGETGMVLSHAHADVSLKDSYKGDGEAWIKNYVN